MNTRVGIGFFEEKMANLQVFIAKVCETYRRQHCPLRSRKQLSSALKYVVKLY